MDIKKTSKQFDIAYFDDYNGHQCSIQKSSLATQDCIWLGVDNVESRMHLTQEQVAELLPILQKFVENGELT